MAYDFLLVTCTSLAMSLYYTVSEMYADVSDTKTPTILLQVVVVPLFSILF